MTWSNSTPDFGGCRFAMQPICGQREAAPGVVPGAAKTEPPTEGGWFLVGCPARSAPPSADVSKPLIRESFPEFLLRGGKVFSVPHRPQKRPPGGGLYVARRMTIGRLKRPQARPAASG